MNTRKFIYTLISAVAIAFSFGYQPAAQLIYGNTFPFWNVTGALDVGGATTLRGTTALSGGTTITGTTTNDAAASGMVGEQTIASVSSSARINAATASSMNVTGITLTPGDYLVNAQCNRTLTATTATQFGCSISPTTNTMTTHDGSGIVGIDPYVATTVSLTAITGEVGQLVGPVRVSVATTASLYVVTRDVFTAGVVSSFGHIRSTRIR